MCFGLMAASYTLMATATSIGWVMVASFIRTMGEPGCLPSPLATGLIHFTHVLPTFAMHDIRGARCIL